MSGSHPDRVLVVGTTEDYIGHLFRAFSGEVLFLTDPREKTLRSGAGPGPDDEIVIPLEDPKLLPEAVTRHLERTGIRLVGVVCFDCEFLRAAAYLARSFDLPFPSTEAVERSRSKYHSKDLWTRAGVPCPEAVLVSTADELIRFQESRGGDVVVKPLCGSGSEHVYRCRDRGACETAIEVLRDRLPRHSNRAMFTGERLPDGVDPGRVFCAESFVGGEEYSCDAVLENGQTRILRVTRKYPCPAGEFGSIMAYRMMASSPDGVSGRELEDILRRAAEALGLTRAWIMADMKIENGRVHLLELTPRPGGDCLPFLIRAACGLDVFRSALDFARGQFPVQPDLSSCRSLAGLLLYAHRTGVISDIDARELRNTPGVLEVDLYRRRGDKVLLPPEDYDSFRLGHVIFEPRPDVSLEDQCDRLTGRMVLDMEEGVCV